MKELIYYIIEIIQETWWICLIIGIITAILMQFAPKEDEWESLNEHYNPNPFMDNHEVDPIDGHKPNLKDND